MEGWNDGMMECWNAGNGRCKGAEVRHLRCLAATTGLALLIWQGIAAAAAHAGTGGAPVVWADWRGPGRMAISAAVPAKLPTKPKFLWRRKLSGPALAGVAATGRLVLVADKDGKNDVLRSLDADTGKPIWELSYAAPGEMDYTNSPRATPVVHKGLVYLLGAFGHLHCVNLSTGKVVWKRDIVREFGGELPAWGLCGTPLVVDDKLIVNPGAKKSSIVALNLRTGKAVWQARGEPVAYSSFIIGTFGGVRQIVGYDAVSLGGWDPNTGSRLWKLVPEVEGDFNVGTPINVDGKLLVATEGNGTRLYRFGQKGKIESKPLAQNPELGPDTSTPVVLNGLVFGCWGSLYCLDLANGLKTLWEGEDDAFQDYVTLIAGNGRVLITTLDGELLLIEATGRKYVLSSRLRIFKDTEVWSHPALVGDRLYIRSVAEIACVLLDGE